MQRRVPKPRECRWIQEGRKGKAIDLPLDPPEGMQPRYMLILGFLTSRIVKMLNSCCFKTLEAGRSGSRLYSQHAGRLRRAGHLRSGAQDQPGQHGKTPFLLKIQKLAGCGGVCL